MLRKTKIGITDLIDTIVEMLDVICKLSDKSNAILDCLSAIEAIEFQINQEENIPNKTIEQIEVIKKQINLFGEKIENINEESVKKLIDKVVNFKVIFQNEVKSKLNVLFLPYKASMWDSLQSVYESALRDEECVVKVVVVPYYQLSRDEVIPTYEGNDFPKDVEITHYDEYNIEEEMPDIIFVHNIYDQYNTITRVYEKYFTSNLKKYTDMLVYIPYNVPSFIKPSKGDHSTSYNLPSIKNVDKIILAGEYLKEAAIREGVPSEKLIVLGSPKLDAMINIIKEKTSYPDDWEDRVKGKMVYVLNTGCMFFTNNTFAMYETLTNLANMTRFVDDTILIWRPHPLTEISIQKYVPFFYERYKTIIDVIKSRKSQGWKNIIYDDSVDYLPALKIADVLISGEGSLLRSYLLTEKKIIYMDKEMPKNSLLPKDSFYYFYDEKEPWYDIVKKISKGTDPLKDKRKGLASKAYKNTDGTCGEKVFKVIKKCILEDI